MENSESNKKRFLQSLALLESIVAVRAEAARAEAAREADASSGGGRLEGISVVDHDEEVRRLRQQISMAFKQRDQARQEVIRLKHKVGTLESNSRAGGKSKIKK